MKELQATTCELRFDPVSKTIYSVDASIYEIKPLGIILPKTRQDLIDAVRIVCRNNIPITPRGAATGITGGCLGKGIIIDTSKYLHNILDINIHEKTATIEPGVIQDQLNQALFPYGFRLGPDTSTGDRATIGGMAANNAAGARSLFYGKMSNAIIEIEMILSTGEVILFGEETEDSWLQKCQLPNREGDIYKSLNEIRNQYAKEIEKNFPNIPRRVSGYNLDELIKPFPLNIAKVLVGSEGSLGVFSKLKVKIALLPGKTGLNLYFFNTMQEAMRAVSHLLTLKPLSLELIDEKIIEAGRQSPSMRGKLQWLEGNPKALLVAEFPIEKMPSTGTAITNPELMSHVWALRKSGLGLLLSKRSYSRAIAFIEDLSIPPHKLPEFIDEFLCYLEKHNKSAGIYGHAGSGCLHIRPYVDLRNKSERDLTEQMMLDIANLVLKMGGALSGEHGDGLIRSWMNEKMFGPKIYEAFLKVKHSFDPYNLMNPGKVVNGQSFSENLRPAPKETVETFFTFAKEGGLVLTADLCNGNGQCRKTTGLMCPSFQVTNDEYDTTRARANTFRDIFNDKLPEKDLAGDELHKILDLCIQCKGCKTECPSQVDMAKMKSEALYHYQNKHGFSLRARLFANISAAYKLGSLFPKLFNAISSLPFIKKLSGIAQERTLPQLADKPFTKKNSLGKKQVVLFMDTYSQFILPQVGHAAVDVLEFLGFQVIIPPWQCCGRPLISKGFLKEAKERANKLVATLLPYAEENIPIIGLEPSCLLSFKDEYQDFFPEAAALASQSILFDSFIAKLKPSFSSKTPLEIYIHTHCHQKAIVGSKATLEVLQAIPNIRAREIGSGCCGMAGSFGYEEEHYHFSTQIANLSLLPAIQALSQNSIIVANGFSCRSQIKDLSGRDAFHLAEVIKDKLL